ncbi:MAG: AAA family ATPase [Acidobacteriota bacterium]
MSDDQREVFAFLGRGATHGAAEAEVERIVTHCSAIFLVGQRVYKVKRAVKFSYLDYSTLALRRRFCEAELALGRRMAPKLYRALRAITRERDGNLALDGAGEPVEWAVEMRRFDQETLLDRLAERNRLTPALMRRLADAIAAFHAAAAPLPERGGSAAVAAVISDNDRNLRLAADVPAPGDLDILLSASRAALDGIAPLLDRRRIEGKVRHCHGDLHLRNICLFEGEPTLFDGIEFSEALASIDVLYDLAFLLMDLRHRGLGGLGNLAFNRYLDRSGDTGGIAAMPLFMSMRAAIRAHVSIAAGKNELARSYLSLALELLRPRPRALVAVGGLSGTGKSTLAQELAAELGPEPGARIARTDVLRKRMMGVAPETRLPPEAYSHAASERVYAAFRDEAAAALAGGHAAIADATFVDAAERSAIEAIALRAGVPFVGLWLEAPAEVLRARVGRRRDDASDAGLAVLERQLAYDLGPISWQRIDVSGDLAAPLVKARALITARAVHPPGSKPRSPGAPKED